MLPVDFAITPGVAKIPEPMTREMIRKYAEDQLRLRPTELASGMVLNSVEGVLGVLGVRSGVLLRLPYGDNSDAFLYPAVLI